MLLCFNLFVLLFLVPCRSGTQLKKKTPRSEGWSLFFVQMKITVFYKLILPLLMGVARHTWTTQNKNCAVSLQCIRKKLSYEVDVLHADKRESLLQVDNIILVGLARHAQITCVNLQCISCILRKRLGMKLGT